MRDGFKRASEDLALELGIRFSDIVPVNYDPQLEAMNELDGRSAAGEFIRRRFGKELHAAFKQGGYVGGEIGYCYELAKLVLAEEKSVADKKGALLMLLDMKLAEFGKDVGKVPSEVADVVSRPALRHAISVIKEATPDDSDGLADLTRLLICAVDRTSSGGAEAPNRLALFSVLTLDERKMVNALTCAPYRDITIPSTIRPLDLFAYSNVGPRIKSRLYRSY
jgi:hypothetical protein